jgi:hypothetical protein
MKKMLAVMLLSCFAFSSYCLDNYNQNLKDLKKEINEVFKKNPADPDESIYLITVTRTSKDKTSGWTVSNPIMKDIGEVKAVLKEVKDKIEANCPSGYKIIAFNEMFFSQQEALEKKALSSPTSKDAVTHDSVLKCVKDFNEEVSNSIIFCNFLYKDSRYIGWEQALYLYALTLFREKNWCFNRDTTILPRKISDYSWDEIKKFNYTSTAVSRTPEDIVKQYVNTYVGRDTFSSNDFKGNIDVTTIKSKEASLMLNFLTNRTYCIYNKGEVFHYNKSAYYKESDILILRNHIYDLGDGYPKFAVILGDVTKHRKIFNAISTEICLDFVCGIRKNNDWKSKRGGNASKLHIIQSNSVEAWCLKKENYPFNVPILYSDAGYYFPNLRIAFGGITHCIELDRTKQIGVAEKRGTASEIGILYEQVQEMPLTKRVSSIKPDIEDYYTIWVHKI